MAETVGGTMAANLLAQAAQTLRRKNEKEKKDKLSRKHAELMLIGHGSSIVGGGAAALVDEKWGGNAATETAEWKGIPTNAILGGAAIVGGAFAGGRVGAGLIGGGTGALVTVIYNLIREKVEFEAEEAE